MDWIWYLISFVGGAAFLELAWYARRRRKHAIFEKIWIDHTASCPSCGWNYKDHIPQKCRNPTCGYEFGPRENPPPGGEKED